MPRMEWNRTKNVWQKECTHCHYTFEVIADGWAKAVSLMSKYFSTSRKAWDELHSVCISCRNNYLIGRKISKPKQEVLVAQNGKCAICECSVIINGVSGAYLDHCYTTGLSRGMLCPKCNMGMHHVDDDEWLAKAIAYRDFHRG